MVQALDADGGGIWLANSQQFRQIAALGFSPLEAVVGNEARLQLHEILSDVLAKRQSRLFDVAANQADPAIGESYLLIVPLMDEDVVLGFVKILQTKNLPHQQRYGQLQFLEERCRLRRPESQSQPSPQIDPDASALVDQTAAVELVEGSTSPPKLVTVDWPSIVNFLKEIQHQGRLKGVAEAVANECRLLFQSDRVSVAVPHGRRVRVIAVSGQDRIQHRSNLIKAMEKFVELVVPTKEPFQFNGGIEEIPPQLERPLAHFIELSGARMLLIVPLVAANKLFGESKPAKPDKIKAPEKEVQGVLVIEQMRQSEPQPQLTVNLDLVRDQLGIALFHARAYESIFLLPVWTAIGQQWKLLRGKRLALVSAVAACLVVVGMAMFLMTWSYRVDAQGQLMPTVKREVFTPWDGRVVELLVRGGDRVQKDQVLITLRNDELASEYAKMRGELAEKKKLVIALNAQIDDADKAAQREEETRLRGKLIEAKIEVEGLTDRLAILADRIDRLTVRSPIAGVVTTFQAEQLLYNRPVQRGEVMLQIMDDRGDWQLELDVPEHRLGHILTAREHSSAELPIEFRLLTRPEASYYARLFEVGSRSVTSEEHGSVIEMRAALATDAIDRPSIGAKVRARIDCGKKALGYCIFGDVVEFVQKYLWW